MKHSLLTSPPKKYKPRWLLRGDHVIGNSGLVCEGPKTGCKGNEKYMGKISTGVEIMLENFYHRNIVTLPSQLNPVIIKRVAAQF